jgi:hypothetical protein
MQPQPTPAFRRRVAGPTVGLLLAAALVAIACDDPAGTEPGPGDQTGFEVWIVDQSDTRTVDASGFGGTLHIFDGADLTGPAPAAAVATDTIDLADATATLCRTSTGRNPVRPHMLRFNREQTHAVLAFVASGHVVILDAARRAPLACFLTTRSASGQQAHAAFPAPDGSYILVANQNGKRLERINTDYATARFVHDVAATLDLATCTTPSGRPCEASATRPDNAPICPVIDESSALGFVTLRGGGMLVVDARRRHAAIRIVAEYDSATVAGNGCGGVEVRGRMYVNAGGSAAAVHAAHPLKFGFDVYRFPLAGYAASNAPNVPAPMRLLSKVGEHDSHGMAPTVGGRHVWVLDRRADVAEVIATGTGAHVGTVHLAGALSADPAPDLVDASPTGDQLFVALRGPTPLSGDPHNATGSTPGLGVIAVTGDGASGRLAAVVPLANPNRQGNQQPDPHAVRVRTRPSNARSTPR